jgi:hypothetical protein
MSDERIGIISEGIEDQGVIITILKAFGFTGNDIIPIRPDLSKDATDLNAPDRTIGTFQGVKNTCLGIDGEREELDEFFFIANNKNIIVHVDTAEIEHHDFPFKRPVKVGNANYSTEMRSSLIEVIRGWLSDEYEDEIIYAIAIEEIEAWVLTAFETKDTSSIGDSKGKLGKILTRNNLTYKNLKLNPTKHKKEYFEAITKKMKFHKPKELKKHCAKNCSLSDFVSELEAKFPQEE